MVRSAIRRTGRKAKPAPRAPRPRAAPRPQPRQKRALTRPRKQNRTPLGQGFREVGGMLGGMVGMPYIGRKAGAFVSKITGQGAYTINSNTLFSGSQRQTSAPVPQFAGEKGFLLSHAEYLGDIYSGPMSGGASQFDSKLFKINPGDTNTFPWLSQIANDFEKYELLGCLFEFRSTTGDAISSTNASLGTVIMSTQYNVNNPAFTSKVSQENFQYCTSGKPSRDLLHPVECAPALTVEPRKYVRAPSGTPTLLTDWGNFQISTIGMQAGGINLGELWVTYHVRFWDSRLLPSVSANSSLNAASFTNYDTTTTFSNSLPWGNSTMTTFGAGSPYINASAGPNLNSLIFDGSLAGKTFFCLTIASINTASSTNKTLDIPTYTAPTGVNVTFKSFNKTTTSGVPINGLSTSGIAASTTGTFIQASLITLRTNTLAANAFQLNYALPSTATAGAWKPTAVQLLVMEVPDSFSSTFTARKIDYVLQNVSADLELSQLINMFVQPNPRSTGTEILTQRPCDKYEALIKETSASSVSEYQHLALLEKYNVQDKETRQEFLDKLLSDNQYEHLHNLFYIGVEATLNQTYE